MVRFRFIAWLEGEAAVQAEVPRAQVQVFICSTQRYLNPVHCSEGSLGDPVVFSRATGLSELWRRFFGLDGSGFTLVDTDVQIQSNPRTDSGARGAHACVRRPADLRYVAGLIIASRSLGRRELIAPDPNEFSG